MSTLSQSLVSIQGRTLRLQYSAQNQWAVGINFATRPQSQHLGLLILDVMVDVASYQQMLLDVAVELAELRYEQESLCSQISHEAERRLWIRHSFSRTWMDHAPKGVRSDQRRVAQGFVRAPVWECCVCRWLTSAVCAEAMCICACPSACAYVRVQVHVHVHAQHGSHVHAQGHL